MNQQIYRIIRAYLDIESAAIVPKKKLITHILTLYTNAFNTLPEIIANFKATLKRILKDTSNDTQKFDEYMKELFEYLNNKALPSFGGNKISLLDPGIKRLNIEYKTNGQEGASYSPELGITVYYSRGSCKKFLEDWYIKEDKNKVLNYLAVIIEHEVIHSKQFTKDQSIQNKKEPSGLRFGLSDDYLTRQEKNLYINTVYSITRNNEVYDAVKRYLNEKGKIVTLREFKRFYDKLLAGGPSWIKYIPPYLRQAYDTIKSKVPEELQEITMLGLIKNIDSVTFSSYKKYRSTTDAHTYLSDPIEIMAYAHSTVDIAHRAGYSKKELLDIISNPENYKEKIKENIAPISYYQFYKDLKGDKNISDKEKKDTWHKFLKYVAEYIDKIYKKEPR